MIKEYRKKPLIIAAVKLTCDNLDGVEAWCGGQVKGIKLPLKERCIDIQTLEGEMRADIGDYIIKGIKGEFYPCKPDIFETSYEEVTTD